MNRIKLVLSVVLSLVGISSISSAREQGQINNLDAYAQLVDSDQLISKIIALGLYDQENATIFVQQLKPDQISNLNTTLDARIESKSTPVNMVF